MTVAAVPLLPENATGVLAQRLRAAAEYLIPGSEALEAATPDTTGTLLSALVDSVHCQPSASRLWLLYTAVASAFPTEDDVLEGLRFFELSSVSESTIWLLESCYDSSVARGAPELTMEVASGRVVVDVDFSAQHELNTGIQRVVRQTMSRWCLRHDVILTAWTGGGGALRELVDKEKDRILRWDARLAATSPLSRPEHLVVPWQATMVLPEVAAPSLCPSLAALAQYSGNEVVIVGHDTIPVLSADLMPVVEPNRFVRFLTVVKHATRVAAVSRSAAAEFQGFTDTLVTQGLSGPIVSACPLPVEVPTATAPEPGPPASRPTVVCVGTHEPRKNHVAVLQAAELLWRQGLAFELRLIGGRGWDTVDFDARLDALQRAGRPVSALRTVTDDDLWSALRSARFTVFPSLHEGYGLPVAESLAVGTPVVTTEYGSTREIGDGGGVLFIDPRDDDDLADGMRRLLTDDGLLERLRREALERPRRTWDDYAEQLWDMLIQVGGRAA
jgi:glycosyltransferase involved in cell wall biosynthesis